MEDGTPTRSEFEQLEGIVHENFKLTQENNRLLLSMRKWGRVAFWFKVLIWTIVLIAPVLLYPYIARFLPAIPGISGITGTSSSTNSTLFGFPSPAAVLEFLHPGK